MCGIAGIVLNSENINGEAIVKAMTDSISHRGPDGEGFWNNKENKVYLGHRRLSIIDLSVAAAQPMCVLEKYVIIYNGEIYNYIELKDDLISKGYTFHTSSDTEVLVCLYDYYKEKCLDFLDGMFSFVIYDQEKNKLFGARDRFGEKPFFYTITGKNEFYFASELKALWAAGIDKNINEEFLFNYLTVGYLQDPNDQQKTFYNNIYKLPVSSYFIYDITGRKISIQKYWDINWREINNTITENEAAIKLNELLTMSLKRRLRSDVPLGSSLSGGIDSSVIVSLMNKIDSDKRIKRKTFSAIFPGFLKDESYYQKLVINNTAVEPHFIYSDEESFLKNFNNILYYQDEPFGSASINIQYEVFKKAKNENVTVLLDGQGADETFAGYHGYFHTYFDELKSKSISEYRKEYELYRNLHSGNTINPVIGVKSNSYIKRNIPVSIKEKYRKIFFNLPTAKKIFSKDFYAAYRNSLFKVKDNFSSLNQALHYSTFNFGLEELLRYADRNSMANSREIRLPFLNHELVKFVFSLPSHFKIRKGWTKWILRYTYTDLIDERVIWRKDKIGYEPPQKAWEKNPCFQKRFHESLHLLKEQKILKRDFNSLSAENNTSLDWRIATIA